MRVETNVPVSPELRGAEFLAVLETKYDQVLNELDALNERIENVLSCTSAATPMAEASMLPPAKLLSELPLLGQRTAAAARWSPGTV